MKATKTWTKPELIVVVQETGRLLRFARFALTMLGCVGFGRMIN